MIQNFRFVFTRPALFSHSINIISAQDSISFANAAYIHTKNISNICLLIGQ